MSGKRTEPDANSSEPDTNSAEKPPKTKKKSFKQSVSVSRYALFIRGVNFSL